ncbi:MAG: hypothetical protein ACKO2T_27670, partial [Microcystis aeruginosa]
AGVASPSICTKISDRQSKLGEMLSDPLYFVNAPAQKSDRFILAPGNGLAIKYIRMDIFLPLKRVN